MTLCCRHAGGGAELHQDVRAPSHGGLCDVRRCDAGADPAEERLRLIGAECVIVRGQRKGDPKESDEREGGRGEGRKKREMRGHTREKCDGAAMHPTREAEVWKRGVTNAFTFWGGMHGGFKANKTRARGSVLRLSTELISPCSHNISRQFHSLQ